MQPFPYNKNKARIEKAVNERLKLAKIHDPKGFTIIEGFVAPTVQPELSDNMTVSGRALSSVAVAANTTGQMYFFYLDILFPGEGLE